MYFDDYKSIAEFERARLLLNMGICVERVADGKLLKFTNLSDINKKYIEENVRYGFKIENVNGETNYYLQTDFADRPLALTCTGLTFQPNLDTKILERTGVEKEYERLAEIANYVLQSVTKRDLDLLTNLAISNGYKTVADVENDVNNQNYAFAEYVYNIFGLDKKVPEIEGQENRDCSSDIQLFSGTRDINEKITRLYSGKLPFSNQSTYGFGYYFSDAVHTPIKYTENGRHNLIKAHLKSDAKVIDIRDLDCVANLVLDKFGANDDLAKFVTTIPQFKTLFCAICGFDAVKVKGGSYGYNENYYIPANLNCITLNAEQVKQAKNSNLTQ